MQNNFCLNCSSEVSQKFCPNCGQKTDTHRITLKHFVLHDLLHGVWHIERGILFTLKEAIVRPGQAALAYIAGKRIRYYNIFYLCLLLIGFDILIAHLYPTRKQSSQSASEIMTFMNDNIKFIIFGFVPILAVNARLLFKKLQLNLAEHFILSGMCLLGILWMSLFFFSFKFLAMQHYLPENLTFIYLSIWFLMFLFPVWTYFNATRKLYPFPGFAWRILLFYLLIVVEFMIFITIMILTVTSDSNLIIN